MFVHFTIQINICDVYWSNSSNNIISKDTNKWSGLQGCEYTAQYNSLRPNKHIEVQCSASKNGHTKQLTLHTRSGILSANRSKIFQKNTNHFYNYISQCLISWSQFAKRPYFYRWGIFGMWSNILECFTTPLQAW